MPCSPNDYMRILALMQSNIAMHFYFRDGSHVKGYVARADLDPVSRSGFMLLVVPAQNRILQCDASDVVRVSSRAPDGTYDGPITT